MAQIQTIIITDTSGTTYETVDALLEQMETAVAATAWHLSHAAARSLIDTCIAEGSLVGSGVLSEDGKAATLTRTWADARWADFSALDGVANSDFTDAGYTVVSEDVVLVDGMSTRQDDTFGED